MPICTVETSLTKECIPSNLHVKLAKSLAEILNKPIERISVTISPGLLVTRGSTLDPAVTVHIWSINVFSKEANSGFGEKLFSFFKKEWPEIDEKKMVLVFHPIEPHEAFFKS